MRRCIDNNQISTYHQSGDKYLSSSSSNKEIKKKPGSGSIMSIGFVETYVLGPGLGLEASNSNIAKI